MASTLLRETNPDGSVVLKDSRAKFTFHSSPGALEIVIAGSDQGLMGSAALDEIARALVRDRPLELFIDATRASMPAVSVSREWARFFSLNQKDLKRVSILVGSKPVELTVAIAQHLSQTGKLIQIYSDEGLYTARKTQATKA